MVCGWGGGVLKVGWCFLEGTTWSGVGDPGRTAGIAADFLADAVFIFLDEKNFT